MTRTEQRRRAARVRAASRRDDAGRIDRIARRFEVALMVTGGLTAAWLVIGVLHVA